MYSSVNVSLDPDLREKVFENALNAHSCKQCGHIALLICPLLYHDMRKEFLVWNMPNSTDEEIAATRQSVANKRGYFRSAAVTTNFDDFRDEIVRREQAFGAQPPSRPPGLLQRLFGRRNRSR